MYAIVEDCSNDQIDSIVHGLYESILGRRADDEGLRTYGRRLRDLGVARSVAGVVRELLSSQEFNKTLQSNPELLGPSGTKNINGKKVSHIVSLGTHCLAAFYLKKYGFKTYSMPFDWLFSSPKTTIHCIEDDFRTFLDESYYESISRPTNEPGGQHRFYLDRDGVGDMFAHRDPTNPDDQAYFDRAVGRFQALLKCDDAKLFVMISRPVHDIYGSFDALSILLRSRTTNSALICVQLREPTREHNCRGVSLLKRDGDHALYVFQPSSREEGIGFEDPADDRAIMSLIRQFDLDLGRFVASE